MIMHDADIKTSDLSIPAMPRPSDISWFPGSDVIPAAMIVITPPSCVISVTLKEYGPLCVLVEEEYRK